MTAAELKEAIPGLASAPDGLCTSALAQAAARISETVFGDLYPSALMYLAAHIVSLDPRGTNARKVDRTGESLYMAEYKRIQRLIGPSFVVL